MTDYTESLGFRDDEHDGDNGIVCIYCDIRFSGGWDGRTTRSHRRRCSVHPEDVYEPAVCRPQIRSAFSTQGYDLW